MRKNLLSLVIVLITPLLLNAQDNVSIHFAQVFSGFRFRDSQGNEDNNLSTDIKYAYGFNYTKLFKSGFLLRPEIGYKNYGAMSTFNNINLEWNLHYADLNLALGYQFNQLKIKPYALATGYFSYMYKGDQIIGSESYDLVKSNTFSTVDYGVVLNAGCKYAFSEDVSVFFEYRYNLGLCQLDNNTNGGSKEVYNRASSIHFGLSFKVNNVKSDSK